MGKGLFRDMAIEWAEIISREIAVTRLRTYMTEKLNGTWTK